MNTDWAFEDGPNTATITTVKVLERRAPILLVTHDEDDGGWQFLCGTTNDDADARIVGLGTIVKWDPSVNELADLPLGWRGLILTGVFPWISVNGVPTETPQHVVGAVLSFSGASLGLIFLSRRMAADPEWQSLSLYVLATGIVMIVLFIALGGFAIDDGAPLHPWAGLLQRVMLAVWFPCIMVIAIRALRIVREQQLHANAVA